jgi:hypothetical protein
MLAGCGIALAMTAVAAEAAVLVVRSSGPSAKAYPAGRALAENQTVTLRVNDVVILLDSRGTRTLRGPGSYNTSVSTAMAGPVVAGPRRSRVGAVRGGPTGATSGRNVWQADIGRSGNVCIVNPADTGLYRAKSDTAGRVTIKEVGSGRVATVDFAAGQKNAAWPVTLPVAPGSRYEIRGGGNGAVTLNATQIAPVPAGLEGLAQSLIRSECEAQLDVLIDTFAGPSAS